ncbi:MAG: hypothetical protein ACI4JT_06225 [Oscillospiraceae bacterium]
MAARVIQDNAPLPEEQYRVESPDTTESVMEKLGLDYGAAIEALISLEISGFLVRGNDGVYRVK